MIVCIPSLILIGCPGSTHPMGRFWACTVVPLSRDNEETSVPFSWKVALSCLVGNPSLNSTIYFNLTDWWFKGLSHCAMLNPIETLQPVLLYWLPYTFSYPTLILFAISIKRWARWHTWTFPVMPLWKKKILNWCHFVSISKNVVFYAFGVVRIY